MILLVGTSNLDVPISLLGQTKLSEQYTTGLFISDKFVFLQHDLLRNKTRNKAPNQST